MPGGLRARLSHAFLVFSVLVKRLAEKSVSEITYFVSSGS